MTGSEQFNDDEMQVFFDTEMQREINDSRIQHEQALVVDRIWNAIDSLGMDLAVSRDPSAHENDFSTLLNEVAEIIDTVYQDKEDATTKSDHVYAFANSIWDEQTTMIEQIAIALDNQLHGNLPAIEKTLIKKKIMARLAIKDDDQKQWLNLADVVLDGDALDTSNPEDFEYITEALEIAANLENTPEVQLYDNILTLLGVPPLNEDLPEDYDADKIELLTYVAGDIADATFTRVKASELPDRHSAIHEVLRSYGLVEDVDLQTVLKLSDSYANQKAA